MRLALVACVGSHEGPWTLAKGNETAVKIVGLGEGEHVVLDCKIGELQESTIFDEGGVFPLPLRRMEKYRLRKVVNGCKQSKPTTVEMILNDLSYGRRY